MALHETSTVQSVPALFGEHLAGGVGVQGSSDTRNGVGGTSKRFHGIFGESFDQNNAGVFGTNYGGGIGVLGLLGSDVPPGVGVQGESLKGPGVIGKGHGVNNPGVIGVSEIFHGVYGTSNGVNNAGVFGNNLSGSPTSAGVFGWNDAGYGVVGRGRVAGRFEGDVEVTGDIRLLNADCAEEFDIAAAGAVDPGTVMILAAEGMLRPSDQAYDKRVAGIISGAGDYRPGIVLDRQSTDGNRQPIALLGKVFCKVDAAYGSVEIGDLLTTSPTPGHAMKAADPLQAFGAVLGKALRPLSQGQGLIPVLVTLQ